MGLVLTLAKILGLGTLAAAVFYVGLWLAVLAAAAVVAVLLVLVLMDAEHSVLGDY